MLYKYFCSRLGKPALIVIIIAFCAPVMAFGDDLGGGISIDGETLIFFVLKGYDITADFTTYTKGGVILNSSKEPLYTDSKEAPGESKVKIRLPVPGDEIVECKSDLKLPLCGYKILEINLFTKDNINFEITVELLKTCLNEFPPRLDQNPPYDIKPPKPEDKEPVGINPKSPTRGPIVNLDKPIEICFHGTIKSLLWGVQPSVADLPWEPVIFIPLCDKAGNKPPCKPDTPPDVIIEVLRAKWYGEDVRKVTTWFKIISGKEKENGNEADLSDSISSQNQIPSENQPCIPCKIPGKTVVREIIIHPPKCLNPCQITTWKGVIDISQNKGAKDNEKK